MFKVIYIKNDFLFYKEQNVYYEDIAGTFPLRFVSSYSFLGDTETLSLHTIF